MAYERAGSGRSILKGKLSFLSRWLHEKRLLARQSRTYILPTSFGFAFAGLSLILLLMAIGYNNNLIYLYTFALVSLALTSMYVTNKNIERLQIKHPQIDTIFANEENHIGAAVSNPSAHSSYDISISADKTAGIRQQSIIPGHQTQMILVPWRPSLRGWNQPPTITIESRFPFGLLRSWKSQIQRNTVLIYPERRGRFEFPLSMVSEGEKGSLGLFRDHRAYQTSDSPRRVDWKASAKFQTLLIKNFESSEKNTLNFTWEQTAALNDFEDRISQLSLWISRAHAENIPYSLHVGDFKSGVSAGAIHFKKCMECLALLKSGEIF